MNAIALEKLKLQPAERAKLSSGRVICAAGRDERARLIPLKWLLLTHMSREMSKVTLVRNEGHCRGAAPLLTEHEVKALMTWRWSVI